MVEYYVLVISKKTRKPVAAVKARKGRSKRFLEQFIKKNTRPAYLAKVVTKSQLDRILKSAIPKTRKRAKRRKTVKRRTRRSKRRTKRR